MWLQRSLFAFTRPVTPLSALLQVPHRTFAFKFDEGSLSQEALRELEKLQKEADLNAEEEEGDPFADNPEEMLYNGPFYEFVRTKISPAHTEDYKLYASDAAIRQEGHGKLIAAFATEIGEDLSEFLHIWAWRDLKERQLAVEFLQKEKASNELHQQMVPWIVRERRRLMTSEGKINAEFTSDRSERDLQEQGIYQLEIAERTELDSDLEDETDWGDALRSIRKSAGAFQVASWSPVVDDPSEDMVFTLWRFDNLFDYDTYIRELARFDSDNQKTIFPSDELLVPMLYSPMQ